MRFVASVVIQPSGPGLAPIKKDAEEAAGSVKDLGSSVTELVSLLGPSAAEMAERFEGVGVKIKGVVDLIPELGAMLPVVLALAVGVAALGAAWSVFDYLKEVIADGIKTEEVVDQLNATLRSNGSASGLSAAEMIEYAESLALATGRSKEQIIAAETTLSRFTAIQGNFKEVTKLTLDLAQAKHIDADAAANILGPAYEGNAKSLTKLKDIGVVLSAGQKQTLQGMIDNGNAAEYQAKLTEILTQKVNDLARAHGQTLAGQIQNAKTVYGEFKEALASEIIPALEDVFGVLIDQAGGWKNLSLAVKEIGHEIGDAIRLMVYGAMGWLLQLEISVDETNATLRSSFAEMLDSWAGEADVLAKIPGIGAAWKGVADALRGAADAQRAAALDDVDSLIKEQTEYAHLQQKLGEHRQALEGDTNTIKSNGDATDSVAKKVKDHASLLDAAAKAIQSFQDKLSDETTKLSNSVQERTKLNAALSEGLAQYLAAKDAADRDAAVQQSVSAVLKEQRTLVESLTAEEKKAQEQKDPVAAQKIAADLKAAQLLFPAQIAMTKQLAGVNYDLGKSNAENLAVRQTDRALDAEEAKSKAVLADAITQTGGAIAQETIALYARNTALGEGFKLGSDEYNQEVARLEVRKKQITAIDLEAQSIERLNAENKSVATAQASFIDWQSQVDAEARYGAGIAGILQQMGLLSAATEKQQIAEEILNAIRKSGLDVSNSNNAVALAMIAIDVQDAHAAVDQVRAVYAGAQIDKWVAQPWHDAFTTVSQQFETTLNTMIVSGKADWKSLWDDFLTAALQALEEWLKRWLEAIAVRNAADASGLSSVGGGSSLSGLGSLFGAGAGAAAVDASGVPAGGLLAGWSGGVGQGVAGGWTSAGVAGAGAEIAAFAVVYFAVKDWIDHHTREFEQFRLSANDLGGIQWSLGSSTAAIDHLAGVADQMVKTITGVVQSLGVVVNGWSGDLTVSRSGHGKDTQYWVQYANGLIAQFGNDAQAAFDFATVQAIKQADLRGLPDEVLTAIKNSQAQTMADLQKEIDQAYQDVATRLGPTGSQVYDIFRKYASSINDALQKALATLKTDVNWLPGSGGGNGLGAGGGGLGPGANGAGGYGKALATKPLSEADEADVKAVTELIAARNQEVAAIRNQLIGVNDSGAQRLASIASFNAGIEESKNLVSSQIAFVQQQLADLGDKSGAAADHLRSVLQAYLDQLNKIPEAISGQQLDMAIFDTLYQYLQGSHKYAAQEVEFARLKVDLEFQAIKAQIIALGEWDKYAQMWQDAYNAAMSAAGKAPHGAGGGGSQRQQAEDTWKQTIQGIMDANRPLMASYDSLTQSEQDLRDKAKAAHVSAAELAAGLAALDAQFKKSTRTTLEGLAGVGTDFTKQLGDGMQDFADARQLGRAKTGIPDWYLEILQGKFLDKMKANWQQGVEQLAGISDPFASIASQADDLRANLMALAKASGMSADEIQKGLDQIAGAEAMAKRSALDGILDTLFGYLQNDKAYAEQAKALKQDEVELQFEILKAQLIAANAWDTTYDPMEGTVLQQGYAQIWQAAYNAAMAGIDTPVTTAGDTFASTVTDAAQTAADSMTQASSQFNSLIKGLMDSNRQLLTGSNSGLSPQDKYQTALADYQRTLSLAQGGNAQALGDIVGVRDTLMQVAQQWFAGGGGQGLGAGYNQLMQQTIQDFAGLALSPDVESKTMTNLLAQQNTTAQAVGAQNHADLVGLRQDMVSLLYDNRIGNVIGGPGAFIQAPAALPAYGSSYGSSESPLIDSKLDAILVELQGLRRERNTDSEIENQYLEELAANATDELNARRRRKAS